PEPNCAQYLDVLVVDDDPDVRALFKEILEYRNDHHEPHLKEYKVRVHEAQNLRGAVKLFKLLQNKIKFVITDRKMPEDGAHFGRPFLSAGDQLIDQLMKIRPDLRVMIISGYESGVE